MNYNTFYYFLFSITVVISVAIAVLALSCGENIVKPVKILGLLIVVLCIVLIFIIGILIFKSPNQQNTKSWWVYTNGYDIPKDTEKILFCNSSEEIETLEKLKDLKNLTMLDFDMMQWTIKGDVFSNCKNLREVTFYQKPENFDENAFAKCPLLETVKLVGNISDWKNFKITVPVDCEIKFLTTKEVMIIDNKINKTITDVGFKIKKTVDVLFPDKEIEITSSKKQTTSLENKYENQTSSVDITEK